MFYQLNYFFIVLRQSLMYTLTGNLYYLFICLVSCLSNVLILTYVNVRIIFNLMDKWSLKSIASNRHNYSERRDVCDVRSCVKQTPSQNTDATHTHKKTDNKIETVIIHCQSSGMSSFALCNERCLTKGPSSDATTNKHRSSLVNKAITNQAED